MVLYSTNNPSNRVNFKEAIFKGFPEDRGLYMPVQMPKLSDYFIRNIHKYSFQEIAYKIASSFIADEIPAKALKNLIEGAMDFPAPLVTLDAQRHVLELFHGPSLAFKDFGARFMAASMSYFLQKDKQHLVILVATSGDTGGAVASGFYKTPGIDVVILYPSGKVSALQEKQLTALGHNITAIEVNGTFDDCQNMVKQAFIDKDLNRKINLSSANSINIARLIPQSFYYFEAYKQLPKPKGKVVFSVPSGNFGNLCAGLFAQKMGLPVHQFIAATNANDVVPQYLQTGNFNPHPSIATISNAMDVGNPSNFHRILALYGGDWSTINHNIKGFSCTDEQTRAAILDVYKRYNYVIDPHAAVGFLALEDYLRTEKDAIGVILETAHPSKFLDVVDDVLGFAGDIPERLKILEHETKVAVPMSTDFAELKAYLDNRY